MALRHGVEVIYHANYADERALDALEAARDRVFVGPALGITHDLCHAGRQRGVTPERSRAFERELEASVEAVAPHAQAGIRVLPGGDYGFPVTPHGTYARDLALFVKTLGFSPTETLVAATRLGGELMGRGGELGVVTRGRAGRPAPRRRRPARGHHDPAGSRRAPDDHEGRRPAQGAVSRAVPFVQADIFTTRPFAGNPAGAILDADGLAEADMRALAAELLASRTRLRRAPHHAGGGVPPPLPHTCPGGEPIPATPPWAPSTPCWRPAASSREPPASRRERACWR